MLAIIAACGVMAAAGQPAAASSLQEELQTLLQAHPGIRAADKNVSAAEQEIQRSRSGYWPKVDFTGDIGPEIIDDPQLRARYLGDDESKSTRTRKTAGIEAREHVFDGFRTDNQVGIAQAGKRTSQLEFSSRTQQFLYEGVAAYIDVLRQRRLIDLALGNEENIKNQLNLEDERVRRGAGIAVDVLQAKSRLQFAKERRVALEGQLADAVSRYNQVYGHGPDLAGMMDPVPPVDALPETVEQAIEIAVRENPTLLGAQVAVDDRRLRKDLARSEYFPVVDVVAAMHYEDDKNAVIDIRRDASVLLQARWNLFNGFANQAAETKAALEYSASQDSRLQTRRKTEEQTRIAWQLLLTTRERVGLLENAVNLASEVYEARKKLREAGKETVINVLDAENEVYTRRIDYTAASYDERRAVYQVLQSIGRLGPGYLGLEG